MFGKKRKQELFGSQIPLSCAYCRRSSTQPGAQPQCTLGLAPKDGKCKRYEYDPLMREPKKAPGVAGGYRKEDFEL